ncbi:Por secretion system C-terminal sorting domain-containing protein [Chryseobacterium arachidis]|uniref:Por secretion system C-terminal sorting domain-containing protein n=1 Tax=Chryseobacterium arachidis TaxID=1416778 RepID=A0A1M5FI32_9FLAO|nr:T9SS type A sorting domain-containing protein [Chryseobacterium arachidis]SHF90791.1 Por secretion system C-terminal sorting domain-containing protein [Chryseobacterium arachidis]
MKKTLLLLFTSSLLFAQNTSELFNTNWYISQMIIGGQTIVTPTMDQSLQPSTFIAGSGNSGFSSKYFNVAVMSFTFSTLDNSFIKNSSGCTLGQYGGSNTAAVQGYDQKNCDFYGYPANGSVFNYQVIPNGSGKTLIITDSNNGNKVYYNNMFLATKENRFKTSITFQNPVKESLIIENVENDLTVKVFNMLGQVVYEGKTADKKIKIDTKNFSKGQYILMIQGQQSQKFIKE